MPERVFPARALVYHVASITITPHVDPPVMESVGNGWETESGARPGVGGHEPRNRAPTCTTSSVSHLSVADHYPSPSLPEQPPALSSDLPINPDIYIPTHGRLIPGQVISRTEEIVTYRDEDGAESTGHLPRDAAQFLADAVDEVRFHTHFKGTRSDCLLPR